MRMREPEYKNKQVQQENSALQKLRLLVALFSVLVAGVIVSVLVARGIVLSRQEQNSTQPCSTASGVYNYQQAAYTLGVVAQEYRGAYDSGKGSTSSTDEIPIAPCLCSTASDGGYNYQQAAYTIGVAAQKYRASYNSGQGTTANFGGAAITLCPAQGNEYTKYSPIYKGFYYLGNDAPKNSTHSEQIARRWVVSTLIPAKLHTGDRIYVTIYSEIPVCKPCQADMVTWNADFQAKVPGSVMVQTQVWQMRLGSPAAIGQDPVPDNKKGRGFVSDDFPAGTGFPLQYEDVEVVPISFQ